MALRATRPMNRRQLQRQSLPAVPRSRAFFAFRTVPERPAAGRRHPPPLLRKGGGRPLCGSPIDRLRCPHRGAASAQGGETIICEPPTAPPIQKAPFVLFDDVFVPSEALFGVRRYPWPPIVRFDCLRPFLALRAKMRMLSCERLPSITAPPPRRCRLYSVEALTKLRFCMVTF